MSSTSDPSTPPSWQTVFGSKAMIVGGEVGCLTVIIVLVSVLGGLWLDNLLGTKPLITIGLVLASAPISIAITFWIARRAVKDLSPPPEVKTTPSKEPEGDDAL